MANLKNSAGLLRDRVVFEQPIIVDDGHGGGMQQFEERFRRWANVTFLRGSEAVIAARLEGRQPIVVRVRALGDAMAVDHTWRIRHRGQVYGVTSVALSDNREFIDFMAQSGEPV